MLLLTSTASSDDFPINRNTSCFTISDQGFELCGRKLGDCTMDILVAKVAHDSKQNLLNDWILILYPDDESCKIAGFGNEYHLDNLNTT